MSDNNIYEFEGEGGLNPCLDRGQKTAAQIRANFRKNIGSLAQEESRSISENVTWGQRKRFADGKINLPYKKFLSYEKGENGYPKIVEKEAKIVREIYDMFYLKGKTPTHIAKCLTEKNIPSPAGKEVQPEFLQVCLSAETAVIFMEAKCGTVIPNIREQYGSVTENSKTMINAQHRILQRNS